MKQRQSNENQLHTHIDRGENLIGCADEKGLQVGRNGEKKGETRVGGLGSGRGRTNVSGGNSEGRIDRPSHSL